VQVRTGASGPGSEHGSQGHLGPDGEPCRSETHPTTPTEPPAGPPDLAHAIQAAEVRHDERAEPLGWVPD